MPQFYLIFYILLAGAYNAKMIYGYIYVLFMIIFKDGVILDPTTFVYNVLFDTLTLSISVSFVIVGLRWRKIKKKSTNTDTINETLLLHNYARLYLEWLMVLGVLGSVLGLVLLVRNGINIYEMNLRQHSFSSFFVLGFSVVKIVELSYALFQLFFASRLLLLLRDAKAI